MGSRSAGAWVTAAVLIGLALSGCEPDGSPTVRDSRSFSISGDVLRIEASNVTLQIVPGSEESVEVERTLRGRAAESDNAHWDMDDDTLRLRLSCRGITLTCEGEHIIEVPDGVDLEIEADDAHIEIENVGTDIAASVTRDGSLTVRDPAGTLRAQSAEGDIVVTGARSAEVVASTSSDGDLRLSFDEPPQRVTATASGSAEVSLPEGSETYRIVGVHEGNAPSDAESDREITVASGLGAARVDVASAPPAAITPRS